MKINFKIATPERVVFKDEVDSITLPTQSGEITILPNHLPLISVLKPGDIVIKKGNDTFDIAVSGGFIEVLSTKVVVLADTAERSEEIDVARAEAAVKRAQTLREEKLTDSREFAKVAALIEKELVRVKVGRKYMQRVERQGISRNN
ncbi:MAG: F0F1 ATP synthase subunit epsilon [Patescibacteria group bacterium]